jgi:predicted TIM-barrel fold metal-dependent hydrolase
MDNNRLENEVMSPYEKMTKKSLIVEIERLNKQISDTSKKVESYDQLNAKYGIILNARKEDTDKIEKAQSIIKTFEQRESEIVHQFSSREQSIINDFELHKTLMKRDLQGQNDAMVALFKMMDANINLQWIYYNEFKSIFVAMKNEKQEQPPQQPTTPTHENEIKAEGE